MHNPLEPEFSPRPKRLENIPGFPCRNGPLNLLDNHALETAISQLEGEPQKSAYPLQIRFYETLLESDILLPILGDAHLSEGLPVLSLETPTGERGLPLFTSPENLSLWSDRATHYVAMPFASLCGLALEARLDYVILNLAGPFGCEISFHDFSYLAEGLLPPPYPGQQPGQQMDEHAPRPGEVLIAKDTPMRLSLCKNFPPELSNRLQQVFQHHQNMIDQVYQFDIAFNEGPMQPAIGIRMPQVMENLWEESLWPNLQAVLYEMLEKHDVVNVFLLNQAGSLEKHLKELTTPVFERSGSR